MANLTINGKSISADAEDDTLLALGNPRECRTDRNQIRMRHSRQCGACTVHVRWRRDALLRHNGQRSGRQADHDDRGPGQSTAHCTRCSRPGWTNDVPQCGYCQSGMIMAVAALLKEKPKPTDEDINEAITNICRCGTFQQVREAIHAAANA